MGGFFLIVDGESCWFDMFSPKFGSFLRFASWVDWVDVFSFSCNSELFCICFRERFDKDDIRVTIITTTLPLHSSSSSSSSKFRSSG